MKQAVLYGLLLLALVGCAATSQITGFACNTQSADFIEAVERHADDWDDATRLAASTARVGLSPVVAQLQQIKRDVADLEVPECAKMVHEALLSSMDHTIEGYLLFMADSPQTTVAKEFEAAARAQLEFLTRLAWLEAGEDAAQPLPPTPTTPPSPTARPSATPTPIVLLGSDGVRFSIPGTAYVSGYLDEDTTIEEVEVRNNAGKRICLIARGTEVRAISMREAGRYVLIESDDCSGWIRRERLSAEEPN